MPDQIFISYRRDDAAYVTGHINDLLRREFGDEAVFTDVDNIALGVDFRAVLDQTVSQCQVLLAVIGPNWLTVQGQDGRPRLQDPADFVRIEIESALQRNIPVIPLLVVGAKMPAAEDLPESLRGLAFRNGAQIRPAQDFGIDMARLIKNLQRHFDAIRAEGGGEPGVQTTTDPTRDGELEEERSPAEVEVQPDLPSKQSEISGISVKVGEEERARRAELGRGRHGPKKRWVARLRLIAIVLLVGAALFYVGRNEETLQGLLSAGEPATVETDQNLDASDDAEVNLTGDAGEILEADVDVNATTGDDVEAILEAEPETAEDLAAGATGEASDDVEAILEAEPEAAEDLAVGATGEAADDTEAILEPAPETGSDTPENLTAGDTSETAEDAVTTAEPAADAAGETSDQPDADLGDIADVTVDLSAEVESADEPVDNAAAGPAVTNDTAPGTDTNEDIVDTPDSQRQPDASELIGEGVRLAAIGEHEGAIQNFEEAIQLDVEQAFVYKQRGASYQALGQYEAAIKDYDEAIRLNGEDVNAYYKRGVSHHALQDYAAAVADFDVVIQLDPEFVDAYSRRADAHEAMGNVEAATRDRAVVAESE